MEERYILMNKDKKLAALDVGLKLAVIDTVYDNIPYYIGNVYRWVEERTSLFGRPNVLNLAKLAGISNEYEYLTVSKAISITDTFWVNDLKYPTTWDKVNPYTNRLSKIMADIAINGIGNYNNQSFRSPSPQYRLGGSVDKCVKRINGDIHLFKTSGEKWSDLAGSRPYSEYYASIVCRKLGFRNYTKYGIKVYNSEDNKPKPYAYCKIFTNEKQGLLEFGDSKFKNTELIDLGKKLYHKDKQMCNDFREIFILDSLILNIDRHSGNWGFLVDNDKYNIIGMAPIYDNDCSLGSTISVQDVSFDEAYTFIMEKRLPRTVGFDYNELAKWAMTEDMYWKLKSIGHISLGEKAPGLSDKRFKFMEYIVNRRKDEILALFK